MAAGLLQDGILKHAFGTDSSLIWGDIYISAYFLRHQEAAAHGHSFGSLSLICVADYIRGESKLTEYCSVASCFVTNDGSIYYPIHVLFSVQLAVELPSPPLKKCAIL